MLFYAITIFLSAFLLFQVQPIIAKIILPWFGGTAAVWTTCLLFFQLILLIGYGYSHFVVRKLTPRRQWMVHSALLLLGLLALPIAPSNSWKPTGAENPTVQILLLLGATIGLPYFLLSTTGPLLQAWYVQANPGKFPYRLYALSNLGSMLALLGYPILVEPTLVLKVQTWLWSAGFAAFAAVCIYTGFRSSRHAAAREEEAVETAPAPSWSQRLLWIALAACPSMLLLALTTHLTQDVAPIPFLWVLPLALYLLTFILCFDAEGWYRRTLFLLAAAPLIAAMAYSMTDQPADKLEMIQEIVLFSSGLFVCCMVCHGELSRRKPHPSHLTEFFLMISVGGALGGAVTAVVAPYLFNANYEFPLALALCSILLALVVLRDTARRQRLAILVLAPIALGSTAIPLTDSSSGTIALLRNFYGSLVVRQVDDPNSVGGARALNHGRVEHGSQYTRPDRRRILTNYYCPPCGIGRTMATQPEGQSWKVGVIGLGAGTMAAYARPGDDYVFYEINPLIVDIAKQYFTYLHDARGRTQLELGDARLVMERQAPQNFDVLAVDAFSGDSIPVHLLTREAMELYFRHLKPSGVLGVHITNHYLNLEPVLERIATATGRRMVVVESEVDDDNTCYHTRWALMTADKTLFDRPEFKTAVAAKPAPGFKPWTDDYSNLLSVLR